MNKEVKKLIGTGIIGFIALVFLVIAPDFIGAGQVGIVTRFGEVERVAGSGLNFHIPFIEGVTKMDTRVQLETVQANAATKDLQYVASTVAINYSISNESALKVYKELGTDYSTSIISPALHESFKQGISRYTAENLITNRTEAKEVILANIKERMNSYGITVVDINLTDLNFSDDFNAAIEQKAVAQQEVERAKQELERVRVEAESKVEAAKAEAEAQRLQQQTLTKEMIQKMWVEKWNGQLPTTATGDSDLMINLGE